MKKYNKRERCAVILLWLYLWLLFFLQSVSADIEQGIFGFVLFGCLAAGVAGILFRFFEDRIISITFSRKNSYGYKLWAIVTVLTAFIYIIYFIGQYPGGMSPDTVAQYSQAIGQSPYNDWHPVLHTLLFFTIPLKTGHQLAMIVFMQIMWFSLAFGYLAYVLNKNGCPKFFVLFYCMYIWVNPFIETYMMYPWKDVAMTIFAILCMAYYVQIICTDGAWLSKKQNLLFFSLSVVVCAYMRHNAILFILPMLIIVLFYTVRKKEKRILLFISVMVFYSAVKILYIGLNVEKPSLRTLETVGLPVTIWCNVMQKAPEKLPDSVKEAMYELASDEAYKKDYITGSFNHIKWSGNIDTEKIDEMSYGKVLKYTLDCFRYAPKESIEAFSKLTDMVWAIDGKNWPIQVSVVENPWGIKREIKIFRAEQLLGLVKTFFSIGFGKIWFGSIGFHLFILFFSAICLFAKGRTAFIHIFPLFCYDFGTMFLLSGDDYRFFLCTIPLWMPLIFIMLQDKKRIKQYKKERKKNGE